MRILPSKKSLVTDDVLREATYAKAVLKESFRLRPISVGIGRVLDSDVEFSGYDVPKGVKGKHYFVKRQSSDFF